MSQTSNVQPLDCLFSISRSLTHIFLGEARRPFAVCFSVTMRVTAKAASHLDPLGLRMEDVWRTAGALTAARGPHAVHAAGATQAAAVPACKTHTRAAAHAHT